MVESTGIKRRELSEDRISNVLKNNEQNLIQNFKVFNALSPGSGLVGTGDSAGPQTEGSFIDSATAAFNGAVAYAQQLATVASEKIDIFRDDFESAFSSNVKLVTDISNDVLDKINGGDLPGQILKLTGDDTLDTVIHNGDGASTTSNILFPGSTNDFTLKAKQIIEFIYDHTISINGNQGCWCYSLGDSEGGGGAGVPPFEYGITLVTETAGNVVLDLNPNSGARGQHFIFTNELTGDVDITFSNTPPDTFSKPYIIEYTLGATQFDVTFNDNPDVTPIAGTINSTTKLAGYITNNGGLVTSVFTMTSTAGSGGTGGSQTPWESNIDAALFNLTNLGNIDFNAASSKIQGLDNLEFFQSGQNIQNKADPDGGLLYNVDDLQSHIFRSDNTEIARFEEAAASIFRLNMIGHSVHDAKDIKFDVNATFAGSGAVPTIGYDSGTSRLLLNLPASGNLFVTNNNAVVATQMNNGSITTNIVNANDVLQLGVDVTVPTVPGEFRSDGSDTFVFSGGAVRNLSNVGVVAGGANVNLSNLAATSVNANIIPQAGKILGSAGNEWARVHTNDLRLGTAGVVSPTDNQISGTVNGIDFNIPTGGTIKYNFLVNNNSVGTISNGGTLDFPNAIIQTSLTLNDAVSFPGFNGALYREGSDVKIFSGGVERNISDVGPSVTNPLTSNLDFNGFDADNLDDIFFSDSDLSITQAAGIMSIRVGASGTIRLRLNTTSGVIYDSSGFRLGNSTNFGVFGNAAVAQQSVGSDTLANLYTALRNYGLIA